MQHLILEPSRKRLLGRTALVERRPAGIGELASTARLLAAALALIAALWFALIPRPAHAATPAQEIYVHVKGSPLGSIATSAVPLTPGFSPSIHDYALRCRAGINTITLTLTAQHGVIWVDDKSGHTVSVAVPLAEGQAAVVEAPRTPRVFETSPRRTGSAVCLMTSHSSRSRGQVDPDGI